MDADIITNKFKDRFLSYGFIPAGNDVKWIIDAKPSIEQITKITNLCFELAESVKKGTLR